jgi:ATP-binding cassette subfamily F protein 3
MLSISHLDIRYGEKHLFKDLSCAVYPGDRIGLIGVNGAGKSSLLKLMAGVTNTDDGVLSCSRDFSVSYLPQEPGVIASGSTLYEEAEGSFSDILDMQKEADDLHQLLSQTDHSSQKFSALIQRQGEIQHQLESSDVYTIRARVEKVLFGLGFNSEDLHSPVSSFSGGWIMRLLLAKMLLASPSLLLLDEPTNHLDLESLTWVESYLQSYQGAMVIISHDRTFLDRITSYTWEISLGKLTPYKGNYSYYKQEKEERQRIEKAAYNNQQSQIRQTMRFVERFKAKATKARQAQSKLKQISKMELITLAEDERTIRFSFPPAPKSGRDVLMVDGVAKTYGDKDIFSGVDLHFERGDKVAVVGVNGAGKTTLLRILSGELKAETGKIKYGSGVIKTYFGQHQAQELAPDYSVLETLSHMAGDMTITRMRSLLGAFLFRGEDVDKRVSVLSGGEKSRLALARMIATPANCMLLDEPTNHLDMSSQEVLQEAMRQYEGTIIVVSHNRYFLDCFVNKVLEIKEGKITVHLGNIGEYLDRQEKLAAREAKTGSASSDSQSALREDLPENRKEKRRKEAQRRQERQRLAGPWLNRLNDAERTVEELELRKEALESVMADPELYQDQSAWNKTSSEYDQCSRRLERWLKRWEEAQVKIDQIDSQLEQGDNG